MEIKRENVMKSKTKIRRLQKEPPKAVQRPNIWQKYLKWITLLTTICGLAYIVTKNDAIMDDLSNLSIDQYQLYVYGRLNYCSEPFDYQNISKKLDEHVIGQKRAIDELKLSLQQHENISAVALFGSQGTGKSLILNIFQKHFQWHLNVQQYLWSPIKSQQSQLKTLLKVLERLTTCGHNAILVDDLPLSSINIINEFHQNLEQFCNKNHVKAIVLYAFQTDATIKPNALSQQMKSINLRKLDLNDVRKCILVESNRMNLKLTQREIDETLDNIDVERNGCKTVAAKIALHN